MKKMLDSACFLLSLIISEYLYKNVLRTKRLVKQLQHYFSTWEPFKSHTIVVNVDIIVFHASTISLPPEYFRITFFWYSTTYMQRKFFLQKVKYGRYTTGILQFPELS